MAQVHGKSKSELLAMTKTPNEGKKGELVYMRKCLTIYYLSHLDVEVLSHQLLAKSVR